MGDTSIEASDENHEASQEANMKATEAISDGKLDEAIECLTEVITPNPTWVIMYATRASVYIKMKKPNVTSRDANAALEVELEEHRRKYERLRKEREERMYSIIRRA